MREYNVNLNDGKCIESSEKLETSALNKTSKKLSILKRIGKGSLVNNDDHTLVKNKEDEDCFHELRASEKNARVLERNCDTSKINDKGGVLKKNTIKTSLEKSSMPKLRKKLIHESISSSGDFPSLSLHLSSPHETGILHDASTWNKEKYVVKEMDLAPEIQNHIKQHTLSTSHFLEEVLGVSQPPNLTPASVFIQKTNESSKESLPYNSLDSSDLTGNMKIPPMCENLIKNTTENKLKSKKDTNPHNDATFEYTELDAIEFTKFELTEDFLSENILSQHSCDVSLKNVGHSKLMPLIIRKSPRISGSSLSVSSASSDEFKLSSTSSGKMKNSYHMPNRKSTAVLSAFQYLIDEAKRHTHEDFQLPSTFHDKIDEKLKSHSLDLLSTSGPEIGSICSNKDASEQTICCNQVNPGSYSGSNKSIDIVEPTISGLDTEVADFYELSSYNKKKGGNLSIFFPTQNKTDKEIVVEANSFILCSSDIPNKPPGILKRKADKISPPERFTVKAVRRSDGENDFETNVHTPAVEIKSIVSGKDSNTRDLENISLENVEFNYDEQCKNTVCSDDLDLNGRISTPKANLNLRQFIQRSCSNPKLPSSSTPITSHKSKSLSPGNNYHREESLINPSDLESVIIRIKESSPILGKLCTSSSACDKIEKSHSLHAENRNESFDSADSQNVEDTTIPSGQNTLKTNLSSCTDVEENASRILFIASPISSQIPLYKKSPESSNRAWKTISRTLFTPLRILEKESNFSCSEKLLSPSFTPSKDFTRDSLPRPFRQDIGSSSKEETSLFFTGCFQVYILFSGFDKQSERVIA